jgi:hypothetical protein
MIAWACVVETPVSVTLTVLALGLILLWLPTFVQSRIAVAHGRVIVVLGALLTLLAALTMLGLLPCFAKPL